MKRHGLNRPTTVVLDVAALVVLASAVTAAADKPTLRPHVVASFAGPSFAESLALGGNGYLYASLTTWGEEANSGQIVRIWPKSGKQTAFGPSIETPGLLTGITFDGTGRVYVADATFSPDDLPGVFRVDQGGWTRVLTLPAESFPNGLTVRGGYLYASDSALGAVWRVKIGKSAAPTTPWFQHALLLPGKGPDDHGIGVNGIAFRNGDLYAAVADAGRIVRIPVLGDGTAGRPAVVAEQPELKSVDGIAFDTFDNLWLVTNGPAAGRVGLLTPFGSLLVLADQPAWLDYPTQPVFASKPGGLGSLYVENGSLENGAPNVIGFTRSFVTS